MTTPLFDVLVQRVGGSPNRRGEVHIDCPFCGKEPKRGHVHFRFSERGYKCFCCGQGGGLQKLARQFDMPVLKQPMSLTRTAPDARKPPRWQSDPAKWLDSFCAAWDRIERWRAYKPLSLETIARWRLGVGRLPSSPCQHRRLIYPIIERGQIVGFRGRSVDCRCDKWISCAGTTARLWGVDLLRPGAVVIIAENPVDCMLAMQEQPEIVSVAGTAGAATWRPEWTAAIVASQPKQVILWYDNDLSGQPNTETYRTELAAWYRRMQERLAAGKIKTIPQPPQPNSPKIANELAQAGVKVSLYRWPSGTPVKADLGWALSQDQEERRAA